MSAPWPAPGTEWPPPEIAEIREKLDDLASIVKPTASAQLDPEIRTWLARLLAPQIAPTIHEPNGNPSDRPGDLRGPQLPPTQGRIADGSPVPL